MTSTVRLILIAVLLATVAPSLGQSTSSWILVTDATTAATTAPPQPAVSPSVGDTYITVEFVGGTIYQYSNWWTSFVERNREGVITASLSGQVNGRPFDDTRSSGPLQLRRNRSQVDAGWSQILVDRLPTTYSRLTLSISVSKTAKDGLTDLISTLASLSSTTPGLQVSQTTLGLASATKAVADFLFNKQLLVPRLKSTIQFPASGSSLPAGLYACLAADQVSDYAPLLNPGILKWNGGQLSAGDQSLSNLSYFLVRVSYTSRIFDKPEAALSLSLSKPWAALYQIATGDAANLVNVGDTEKIADEIRNHLINGNTLLDSDPDYIQAERDEIKVTVRDLAQKRLDTRIAALTPAAPPPETAANSAPSIVAPGVPGTGGTVLPTPATNPRHVILVVPDDVRAKDLLRAAQADALRRLAVETPH